MKRSAAWAVTAILAISCAQAQGPASKPDEKTSGIVLKLNEYKSRGVTKESNAARDIVVLFDSKRMNLPEDVLKALGITANEKRKTYVDLYTFLLRHYPQGVNNVSNAGWNDEAKTRNTLWVKEDCPAAFEWIEENGWALDAAVKALEKPGFFIPIPLEAESWGIYDFSGKRSLGTWREFANALSARSLYRWRSGDKVGSANDIQAIVRLGIGIGNGISTSDALVGNAIAGRAWRNLAIIASMGDLNVKDAQFLLDMFTEYQRISFGKVIGVGEKLLFEHACQRAAKGHTKEFIQVFFDLPDEAAEWPVIDRGDFDKTDWNTAAKANAALNERAAVGFDAKEYLEGLKILKKLEEEVLAVRNEAPPPPGENREWQRQDGFERARLGKLLKRKEGEKIEAYSARVATLFSDIEYLPGILDLAWRVNQHHDLACVALALAGYKAEKGRYPESLDTLSPKWLEKIPKDHFSGKELIYRRENGGCIIYSVDINGVDDGGADIGGGKKGDLVVQLK
jgi:hypothetical protein